MPQSSQSDLWYNEWAVHDRLEERRSRAVKPLPGSREETAVKWMLTSDTLSNSVKVCFRAVFRFLISA